jgi:GT2 family glycosyltransferase
MPSSTVAVCTRDRPEDLRRCLDSICASAGRETQVLVVDNAPSDEAASRVAAGYPVSYIREEQPGLNWARARAVREARGDVILFTDDDVVVDPGWIDAMRGPFTDASVGAVTGLLMPLELDTPAQWLFEAYGGFSRGFRRLEFSASNTVPAAAGRVGAGASMAFRRTLAETMGFFEVELDCGTATRSGGDAYAFYRVLRSGHRIVYTPAAVAWHRHRRDMEQLRSTLFGYSVGVYAFLLRCLHEHGDLHALSVGWQWFRGHHLREISRALRRQPGRLPLDLLMAEVRGCLAAPYVYISSRRRERLVMQTRTSSRPPAIRPAE